METGISIFRHEAFIFMGLLLAIMGVLRLSGYVFSSDWFWVVIGIAIALDGSIGLKKHRQFERKYKVIEKKR